ncbi:hypothetical protein RBU60_13860 [Mesonia sp. MT50]|uniref:Uncharacterized protein n=1 Tax=Mesonia profundi TaxID=3070998 RepID=A0ABU1A4P0_9FLAO|nr:hypothetical protein [Mesonia profundi]MDQ7918660.1 hypothetical protein [Mesonia profundi]
MKHWIFAITLVLLFSSCSEIKTSEPTEVYSYWSGSKPPENLKVIQGEYWESVHWSKEYIMSLKFEAPENWWNEFTTQNELEIDTVEWSKPNDFPNWFTPSKNSIQYKSNNRFDQGSRYFRDRSNGECYIYEVQL